MNAVSLFAWLALIALGFALLILAATGHLHRVFVRPAARSRAPRWHLTAA
jgi:hypothetical protein